MLMATIKATDYKFLLDMIWLQPITWKLIKLSTYII